ncbi:unnamed protein product [Rotaria sordida]|uniref:non-specific serine/threonine protein kinase n=1 Tax=Rotaria sordida TaxID=392033 RepID=A0A815C298_9BILA|nr:unnamed protein product [Rotaria sordida]CAF3683700.1 unnamed protein product [Rotaria sordida]
MNDNNNINVESRYHEVKQLILNDFKNDSTILSIDGLLDALLVLHDECSSATLRKEKTVNVYLENAKAFVSRIKQCRLNRNDFEKIKTIGRGGFGEVVVVKMKNTEQIFAMKIMNKSEMLKRADLACFREERDVLVFGDPQWITKLYYAFHDSENLYLLMEYYYGGDILTLLSKYDDEFSEDMTRFYIAETILAIDSLHKLGYIHRDIKPDNILIDGTGHIRLADFGSCLRMRADGTVQSNAPVGTPDYVSPEVLGAVNKGQGRFGSECDWWSLGCVMWEMLFGSPPFYAETLIGTYGQITARGQNKIPLSFPDDIEVSNDAKDLLEKLLDSADNRLGKNGLGDFKKHPFFKTIDWNNLKQTQPPFIPVIDSPMDTTNFNDVEPQTFDKKITQNFDTSASKTGLIGQVPFIGFTYSGDNHSSNSIEAIQVSSTSLIKTKTASLPAARMIIPSTKSSSSGNHSSSIDAVRQPRKSQHEEIIKSLELERKSLVKELNLVRQLYDEAKGDSIIQTRQMQLLKDFYTEQQTVSKHEQIEYFTRILNLFQDLPGSNRNKNFNRQNSSPLSLEDIRNEFDQRLNSFLTNYKSLLIIKDSKDKDKSISNDISLLISKFQDKFSHLFSNNGDDEMVLITEDKNINNPLLKNIISFLNGLYKQINKILYDKTELSEQLISLEKNHRKYFKIQAKMYKTITEDKHSNLYLKQLADQMAEEVDQIQDSTNRRPSISSRTPSFSTVENKPSRVLSHSLKLQHMEIQELRITVEREINVRQQVEKKLEQSEEEIMRKIDEITYLKQENELIKKQLFDEQAKHLSITTIPGALKSSGDIHRTRV